MYVQIIGEKEFDTSYAPKGISEMEEIMIFPPTASYGKIDFLWHACSTSYDANRTYMFMSGYTRLVLRLDGGQLLLNHNNESHSHVVKRVRLFLKKTVVLTLISLCRTSSTSSLVTGCLLVTLMGPLRTSLCPTRPVS